MKCSICSHADRAQIDQALVEGVPVRALEARHSGTTRSALDRHRKHIPPALTQAKQAREVADADSLLSRVERWLSRCERLFDRAEAAGEWSGAASAAREVSRNLELLGKLSGQLQPAGARVAITLTEIQSLNVAMLTKEQVGMIYDRVKDERLREVQQLTDQELDSEIARILGPHLREDRTFRERVLGPDVPESHPEGSPQVIDAAFSETAGNL